MYIFILYNVYEFLLLNVKENVYTNKTKMTTVRVFFYKCFIRFLLINL